MTLYLSYIQYKDMGGTLDEGTFNDLAYDAQAQINWYTFNRLKKVTSIPDDVKLCMYRLIKILYDKYAASVVNPEESGKTSGISAAIASQSNDGVSISYNIISASQIVENSKAEITACIQEYLQDTKDELGRKLLYRGLYPDE